MALTDDYKRCLTRHPYTLDIFHFLGLHADFKKRYPADFGIFDAKDYDRADLTEQQREILAHYDNAIVYNDLVIDSILRLYEDKDAIAIFVADHGERIAAIGGELEFDLGIVKTCVLTDIDAHRRIIG